MKRLMAPELQGCYSLMGKMSVDKDKKKSKKKPFVETNLFRVLGGTKEFVLAYFVSFDLNTNLLYG